MVDKDLRKAIDNYSKDMDQDVLILDNHAYDDSIIGLTEDGRLIYDFDSMIREYMEDEKCSETDALEWLEYNTLRSLPYLGERAPIIRYTTKRTLVDNFTY